MGTWKLTRKSTGIEPGKFFLRLVLCLGNKQKSSLYPFNFIHVSNNQDPKEKKWCKEKEGIIKEQYFEEGIFKGAVFHPQYFEDGIKITKCMVNLLLKEVYFLLLI